MWKSTPHNDCQHLSVTYNTPLWLLPPHCDCDWQNTVWLSTAVRSTIMIPTATGPSPFMVCLLSDSFLKLHIQGPGDLLWWTYSHWLPRQEHQVAAAFCIKVPWTCLMKWKPVLKFLPCNFVISFLFFFFHSLFDVYCSLVCSIPPMFSFLQR